ncbi:hypothetical protein [Niveibacterium sp.]|uniref:hypothetical protein n=1 Tax=Niveibacterium sp. TaxID=2017444 RepID=UPI0035B459F6
MRVVPLLDIRFDVRTEANMTPGDAVRHSFCQLLYRYFWPFQYFRDVTRGSHLEQAQNYRFNRAMRRYLPGFAVKWCCLSVLWFGAGAVCETALSFVVPAACCYLTATGSFMVVVQVAVAWVWLSHFPERF